MKTKQQIIDWLKAQEWFELFKRETERENRMTVEEYIKCGDDRYVISGAFIWDKIGKGRYFWSKVNQSYLIFLNDE